MLSRQPAQAAGRTEPATGTNEIRLPRRNPMKAMWNGAVLAESDQTVVVEGNHYFPPDSIRKERFQPSDTHTECGWKGTASYYTVEVDGKRNPDAAWSYPEP